MLEKFEDHETRVYSCLLMHSHQRSENSSLVTFPKHNPIVSFFYSFSCVIAIFWPISARAANLCAVIGSGEGLK